MFQLRLVIINKTCYFLLPILIETPLFRFKEFEDKKVYVQNLLLKSYVLHNLTQQEYR